MELSYITFSMHLMTIFKKVYDRERNSLINMAFGIRFNTRISSLEGILKINHVKVINILVGNE